MAASTPVVRVVGSLGLARFRANYWHMCAWRPYHWASAHMRVSIRQATVLTVASAICEKGSRSQCPSESGECTASEIGRAIEGGARHCIRDADL